LNLHGLFAAVYLAFAALGAEHAAAADFTGVSLAELVGHLAALRGINLGVFLLEFHGGLATGDGAVAALGHDELGTALAAYVAFAGLISQLLSSIDGVVFQMPLGSFQL
jgi:hypothetical protein|tara:strand:+ start:568 stop:894 length:327 start_codon:yes stop_codon:yes gene_type:complete